MTTPRKGAVRGEGAPNAVTVDEAVAETVHRTPGMHPKAVAGFLGRTHRYVLDIADELRDAELKASEIAPLVNGTGNPLVLDVIERLCGRVAYALPSADATCGDSLTQCAAVLKETADVVRELAKATEDREVTAVELDIATREGEQAIAAILSALACARSSRGTR